MTILSWEGMIVNLIYIWYFEVYKSVLQKIRKNKDESTIENALASQDLRLHSVESTTDVSSVDLSVQSESISTFT